MAPQLERRALLDQRNAREVIQAEEVQVLVDGERFAGWETVQVVRPLDAVAGSFQLSVAGRRPWLLLPGKAVTVLVGEDAVLEGYVDGFEGTGDRDRTQVMVTGRDRTADLVDCSEVSEPGEWVGLTLPRLVAAIAQPLGVGVRTTIAGGEPFERFRKEPGETSWQAIERALRKRGAIAYTAGDGDVLLSNPGAGTAEVDLVEGGVGANVVHSQVHLRADERFSPIIVRGQRPGSDDEFGAVVAQAEGRATDAGVERNRPLLVLADGAVSDATAETIARWEATVRAARAATVTVTVQGWRQVVGGPPWRVNDVVRTSLPRWNIEASMLVQRVTFTRTESETLTLLELTREDAYALQPEVPAGEANPFADLLSEDVFAEGVVD